MVIYWGLFIGAASAVFLLANPILALLHANTRLLEGPLMIFAILVFFLQYNQICFSLYIGMGNKVPYMKGEFWSGVAAVILSYLVVQHTSLAVAGILLSQCIVQLCYNDWKWPYEACRQMGVSLGDIRRTGMKSIMQMLKRLRIVKK